MMRDRGGGLGARTASHQYGEKLAVGESRRAEPEEALPRALFV